VGAQFHADGAAFRVWARNHKTVSVVVNNREHPLRLEGDGYFVGDVKDVRAGDTYRFLLDGEGPFPDPAFRYQPEGPHGPSQIIEATKFAWTDQAWQGIKLAHQVIYELTSARSREKERGDRQFLSYQPWRNWGLRRLR
jgi:maltooligosyltrehalose trehalohydrolase